MSEGRDEAPKALRIYIAFIYALATALMFVILGEGLAHEQWAPAVIGVLASAFFGRRTAEAVRAIRQPTTITDPDSIRRRGRRSLWVILGAAGLTFAGLLVARASTWMTIGIPAYMAALALFARGTMDHLARRPGKQAQSAAE